KASALRRFTYKSIPNVRHIRPDIYSLHIRVRAFAAFGDEAVDARSQNGQRHRAELEDRIVEGADVEFCPQRFLRLFAENRFLSLRCFVALLELGELLLRAGDVRLVRAAELKELPLPTKV